MAKSCKVGMTARGRTVAVSKTWHQPGLFTAESQLKPTLLLLFVQRIPIHARYVLLDCKFDLYLRVVIYKRSTKGVANLKKDAEAGRN